MTDTKITVMLVDDHAIVRGGVAAYLSAQKTSRLLVKPPLAKKP